MRACGARAGKRAREVVYLIEDVSNAPRHRTREGPGRAGGACVQSAVPADQGAGHRRPDQRRLETRPGAAQRSRAGGALRRQPGHGAQGAGCAGSRATTGAPPGQGHLRRDPCRAADAIPFPAADARRRAARPDAAPLSGPRAPARAGRGGARARAVERAGGAAPAPAAVVERQAGGARRDLAAAGACSRASAPSTCAAIPARCTACSRPNSGCA